MPGMTSLGTAFLSAWADDESMFATVLFGRATQVGPDLEHSLAMCSIGQDEFGHADLVMSLFLEGDREKERYYFERDVTEFRNCALLRMELFEDWALFVARAFLYEEAEAVRLAWLEDQGAIGEALADRVRVMVREEQEHLPHWRRWIRILASGGAGPRERLDMAFRQLADYVADTLWLPEGSPPGPDGTFRRRRVRSPNPPRGAHCLVRGVWQDRSGARTKAPNLFFSFKEGIPAPASPSPTLPCRRQE